MAEHLTGEHNAQFDHEAFLGTSESDKFDTSGGKTETGVRKISYDYAEFVLVLRS